MSSLRMANLGLRFILELCALAAFAAWGLRNTYWPGLAVTLAVVAPVAAAVFWGVLLSPKARVPLGAAARLALEVGFFALAAVALFAARLPVAGRVFALAVAAHEAVNFATGWKGRGRPSGPSSTLS